MIAHCFSKGNFYEKSSFDKKFVVGTTPSNSTIMRRCICSNDFWAFGRI